MRAKFLLSTLCISLLLCSFVKAEETVPQNILIAPSAPGKFKGFSIPFTDDNETTHSNQRSSFSLQLGETNRSIPTFINMKSNGIWINNSTRSDFSFHCEASQTCKYQKPAKYTWQELVQGDQTQTTISGSLLKERVSLGGSVTLPNADILLVNEFSDDYWTWQRTTSGVLGLSFRRPHPQVPTFFEYLKTEGIVEKSIFAIYLDKNYNGELTFGGFDAQKVESEFQYAKWKEDQDPETPGFSLPTKGIGYGNKMLERGIPVVIDFDVDYVVFPEIIVNKIINEKYSRGQIGNCDMIPFLEDVVIELYGMTLRIPPAAYLKYGENTYYEGPKWEKKTVIDCSGLFLDIEEDVERPKIVLGRPFLKLFYTVFNHEEKTVGFSKIASLEKEYPFSQPAGDHPAMHYYLPLKVGGALAVLLIAKFCVILYFIRKTWKGPETSSEDLVSPKIEIGNPEYSKVENGNQEDYQQDSHNIDVGKITIEEEKFYA